MGRTPEDSVQAQGMDEGDGGDGNGEEERAEVAEVAGRETRRRMKRKCEGVGACGQKRLRRVRWVPGSYLRLVCGW